ETSSDGSCGDNGVSCTTCGTAQTCSAGTCVAKCTPTSCPSGCCDATGTCITATSTQACGTNGAACGPCTGSNQCVSGVCGCNATSDCPANQACNLMTHGCGGACVVGGVTLQCNTGCCDLVGGTCQTGVAGGTLCGNTGAACLDCSTQTSGHVCELGGTCGCSAAGDCPTGNACSASKCGTTCTGPLTCNGACCDGTSCQTGDTQPATCGVPGGTCVNCTSAATGTACLPGGKCGCTSNANCTSPNTCGGGGTPEVCGCTKASCGAQCGSVPDGCGGTLNCGPCTGGCCDSASHTCMAGTSSLDCGGPGSTCRQCGLPTNTCGSINGVVGCHCTTGSCPSPETCSLSTGQCQ
ncbi:MAG TPA: hypothetical protein VIJ22_10620, partial [Polyangiaceae bacterium]